MRAAVLTVSTSKAAGDGEDESGPLLERLARDLGAAHVERNIVADRREAIEACLRGWSETGLDLVLTSGGTGMSADDVTPEATLAVLDRQVPGIAEAMRLASRPHTEHWMLSRAVAGTSRGTLIVNLPGNPRAITQVADELRSGLRHALALIARG